MQKGGKKRKIRPEQEQRRPGHESSMHPEPVIENPGTGSGKLLHKIALITGGDSGIGRAVAALFAREGADIAIMYLNEHADAEVTRKIVEEKYQRRCILIPGDVSSEKFCKKAVRSVIKTFGRIDILVNNAAVHYEKDSITKITTEQLQKTFSINVFSMFWITQAALKYMPSGGSIINTSSVTAYRGSPGLIDYAATKGAIVSFTRSLSASLIKKGIRVNGVAPGPVWTPLIASSFKPEKVAAFGSDAPMQRAGEPAEVAPSYLFLASEDSSFITGQFIHPNGGEIING